jgi:hypothetical protein
VDLTVQVGDLTLDAIVDSATRVSHLDGFGTANGQNTQILPADRATLLAFYHTLDQHVTRESPEPTAVLDRVVSMWAEHPTTVSLTRVVMGEENRSWTMECGYAQCWNGNAWSYTGGCASWTWYSETHDCWSYNDWDANSSQNAQLGDHYGSTYYWTGSSWAVGSPDHWAWPYEVGDCNGRCGADCGSSTQYTQDCANHDGCVRNGHDIASLWCDDEFTSASDDWTFAPNCY